MECAYYDTMPHKLKKLNKCFELLRQTSYLKHRKIWHGGTAG